MKAMHASRWGRYCGRAVAFVVFFVLGLGATSAWAGLAQDGRLSNSSTVDGGSLYVQGQAFYPRTNQCVLYSMLVWDSQAPRHVETGIVRCDSATIDGTCAGGKKFAERFNGSDYFCNPGGDFDNNTLYFTYTQRDSSTSSSMTGHIGSGSISQSGFGLSDNTYTLAWGEATGGSACPNGAAEGEFSLWNKYKSGSGWSTISNAGIYHNGGLSPCWTVGVLGSNGGFHVWP